jgi:hypothetical protein
MHVHETVVDHPAQAQPGERHEPWCDLRQHALARAEAMGPSGCVGRYVSSGGVGGWIAEDAQEPGTGARIVLDWRPAEGWSSLRPDEVEQLSGLLDRLLAEQRQPAPVAWAPAVRLFGRGRQRPA